MSESHIQINGWQRGFGWKVLWVGPYKSIPQVYSEDVALLDASDSKALTGVGLCYAVRDMKVYYLDKRIKITGNNLWRIEYGGLE